MSLWSRIAEALSALGRGEGLSAVFDRLRGLPPAGPERSVAFTIAVLALGAKMAKADGEVTRDEVAAFRRIFVIEPEETGNAARVFDLARQDVAGYDAYARKIAALFAGQDRKILLDVLEGLFAVALADGNFHPDEDAFLADVARIFRVGEPAFRALRARFVDGAPRDPYEVLGVSAFAPLEVVRAAWRQAVKDSHPDTLVARGVPPEAVRLAERRLIAVNEAWDEISGQRAA